jgi:hypothetical protein
VGCADGVEHAFDFGIKLLAEGVGAELEAGLDERCVLFDGDAGLASTLPRIQLSRSVTVWSRNSSTATS